MPLISRPVSITSAKAPIPPAVYENGAAPFTPSTNLSGKVDLHSGDVFDVHMSYDGEILTVDLADTATGQTVSSIYTVNIPPIVGGKTASIGFTAGCSETPPSRRSSPGATFPATCRSRLIESTLKD